MVKIDNVSKYFNGLCVLDQVNLKIADSSILGLTGPSGSGKSTLLRCIQGLEKPDVGSVVCDKRSTFMFQDFQLFPHMTVLENLTYAPKFINKDEKHETKAMILLEKVGISDKALFYPSSLSGGQKQRVALCRNLMLDPELLLCDEPTSGLDIISIKDVADLIRSVQEFGVSVIIASHDLDFITQIADRIVLLKSGQIATDINVSCLKDPIDHLRHFY